MLREAARRLVEDDHAGARADGRCDLQHLLLTRRQHADALADIDVRVDRRKHQFGAPVHLGAVEKSARRRQHAKTKILSHREVLAERELLVDHADARRECLLGPVERHRPSEQHDLASIRRMDAGQDFSKRALPGAILAAERVAGTRRDVEADALERARPRKPLRDGLEADGWHRHGIFKYASGTSVKPQVFSWRAHVPRFSFDTRTSSMGMICGTSCLRCTFSTIF